ncbi:MAG: hypothetical protein KJ056_12645 [Acidimicrobiia bacterium]|nr:hypothetical protein [Acidimicrobiia bacterium]
MTADTDRITDAHRAETFLDQIDSLAALIRNGLPAPDLTRLTLDDETGRYTATLVYEWAPSTTIHRMASEYHEPYWIDVVAGMYRARWTLDHDIEIDLTTDLPLDRWAVS